MPTVRPARVLRRSGGGSLLVISLLLTACSPSSPPAYSGRGSSSTTAVPKGDAAPGAAFEVARRLVSPDPGVRQSAFTHEASDLVTSGRLFPSGTKLVLDHGSWLVSGAFANAAATVTEPGKEAQVFEIGFMKTVSGWRVTFVEAAP